MNPRKAIHDKSTPSVKALQVDLDSRLIHYTRERPVWAIETRVDGVGKESSYVSVKKVKRPARSNFQVDPLCSLTSICNSQTLRFSSSLGQNALRSGRVQGTI